MAGKTEYQKDVEVRYEALFNKCCTAMEAGDPLPAAVFQLAVKSVRSGFWTLQPSISNMERVLTEHAAVIQLTLDRHDAVHKA